LNFNQGNGTIIGPILTDPKGISLHPYQK